MRDWTKEEMMAYIDWSNTEDKGVEVPLHKGWQMIQLKVADAGWHGYGSRLRKILESKRCYIEQVYNSR